MTRVKLSNGEIEKRLADLEGWSVEGKWLKRRFTFENFSVALAFVNAVGVLAEESDHHPDIAFGWGYAEISLTTHDTGGLTKNDFDLAKAIDRI